MSPTAAAGRRLVGALGAMAGMNLAAAAAAHVMVVARVGANSVGDAYFAALVVPQLLTGVLFGAILNATVPHLTTSGQRQDREARSLLLGVLVIGVLIAAAIALAAPLLVPLVAPGFDAAGRALTTRLMRIGIVGALAACGTAVVVSWYHARDRFIGPETLGLVGNAAFLVGTIAFVNADNVETAAWFNVVSYALPLVVLAVPLLLTSGRPAPVSAVRGLGRRIHPLAGLGLLQNGEPAVERALVSLGPPGGVALYSLARQVLTGGLLVLDKAVAAPMLPVLTRAGSGTGFGARLRRGKREAVGLGLLAVAVTAVAGPILIPAVSDATSLSDSDLTDVWHLALLMGGGLVFGALFIVTAKGFYARGDRVTPTRLAAIAFPVGVGLRIGGYALAGAAGIALAVSLQWVALAVALGRARIRGRPGEGPYESAAERPTEHGVAPVEP